MPPPGSIPYVLERSAGHRMDRMLTFFEVEREKREALEAEIWPLELAATVWPVAIPWTSCSLPRRLAA